MDADQPSVLSVPGPVRVQCASGGVFLVVRPSRVRWRVREIKRESHYGYCRMVSKNPPIAQDCWAFSLDPRGRASTGGIRPTTSSYWSML